MYCCPFQLHAAVRRAACETGPRCALQSATHLCRRFTTFVTKYGLMTKENLNVPILEEEPPAEESEA